MVKLKKCPLCGGTALYQPTAQIKAPWQPEGLDAMGVSVVCQKCGCTIPSELNADNVAEVWNKRTK